MSHVVLVPTMPMMGMNGGVTVCSQIILTLAGQSYTSVYYTPHLITPEEKQIKMHQFHSGLGFWCG